MLAPILAAYVSGPGAHSGIQRTDITRLRPKLAQKESKSDPQFTELCRSLSSDVGIPWVRGTCKEQTSKTSADERFCSHVGILGERGLAGAR